MTAPIGQDTDPYARFRHRPGPAEPDPEPEWLGETRPALVTVARWLYGTFFGLFLLAAVGRGDPDQWRWILGPVMLATGLFTVVRPQAAVGADDVRRWFRVDEPGPTRTALRWTRVQGVFLVVIGLVGLTAGLLFG